MPTSDKMTFGRTVCILLSGKAGVGKTTSAQILKDIYSKRGLNVENFSFAAGVKAEARRMGWNGEKDEKGRKFLQEIGKVAREYDKDCWAKITFDGLIMNSNDYPFDVVIIDDYRFPNEGNFVRNSPLYHVFEVRVFAPNREMLKGTENYLDVSENSLPEVGTVGANYFSFIDNCTTMDDLYEQCGKLVKDIEPNIIKW